MQLATTLKGVTPALATVDMQAMGSFAQVSASIFKSEHIGTCVHLQPCSIKTTVPICLLLAYQLSLPSFKT